MIHCDKGLPLSYLFVWKEGSMCMCAHLRTTHTCMHAHAHGCRSSFTMLQTRHYVAGAWIAGVGCLLPQSGESAAKNSEQQANLKAGV